MLNKPQRVMVLASLATLALGLHVWHYEYRGVWWDGAGYSVPRAGGQWPYTLLWWNWGVAPNWPPDYCAGHAVLYVEPDQCDRDVALLCGILAPIAVLGVGVFLMLGWRSKSAPPRPASTEPRQPGGAEGQP